MQPMETAIAVLLVYCADDDGPAGLVGGDFASALVSANGGVLGGVSPLLLVPAYEPFVALALQGAVVAGGVSIGRWALSRKRRKSLEGDEVTGVGPQWRFSMATLLLAMVLCGVAAAVASQSPQLNRYAWQSVALIGAMRWRSNASGGVGGESSWVAAMDCSLWGE